MREGVCAYLDLRTVLWVCPCQGKQQKNVLSSSRMHYRAGQLQRKSPPGVSVRHGVAFSLGWMCYGTLKATAGMGFSAGLCLGWELKEDTPELPVPFLATCGCAAFVPMCLSL